MKQESNTLRNQILDFLINNSPKAFTFLEIVKSLRTLISENHAVSDTLASLVEEKQIIRTFEDKFVYLEVIKVVQGTFKLSQRSFGFVDVSENESYFVARENFNNALDDYFVEANIYRDTKDENKTFAIITKNIEEKETYLIGTIEEFNNIKFFSPYNFQYRPYRIFWDRRYVDAIADIVHGDIVKALVTSVNRDRLELKFIKKISQADLVLSPVDIILEKYQVDTAWPANVITESDQIEKEINPDEIKNRKDLRAQLIVTIDGNDTKDFDDAIIVTREDNLFKLGVHIADVSHYVKEDSAIDLEALKRGTSIYLPHAVIPMLPESLSNGICSLNPNVDRFTMSAEIWVDQNGEVVKSEIFESVINSKHRLTYEKVNEYYNAKAENTLEEFKSQTPSFNDELMAMLDDALALSEVLKAKKLRDGFIELEIEEAKVILDHEGYTKEIKVNKRGLSEVLIENFMVLANEVVATEFEKRKLPGIFRIHEAPDFDSLQNLGATLKILGIDVAVPQSVDPRQLAKVIESIKEKSHFDNFLKLMVLRTMQKAIYSDVNRGHFGLASKAYSHFTSPIRRYPDLILHRMIRRMILTDKNKENVEHFHQILSSVAKQSSEQEQNAVTIERAVNDIKKAEFYKRNIGITLKAQIVSILNFGLFVEFEDTVSAMIHISNLMGDEYKVNENKLQISGHHNSLKVGDTVEVIVVKVDEKLGKVDAVLAKDYDAYLEKERLFKEKRTNDRSKGGVNQKFLDRKKIDNQQRDERIRRESYSERPRFNSDSRRPYANNHSSDNRRFERNDRGERPSRNNYSNDRYGQQTRSFNPDYRPRTNDSYQPRESRNNYSAPRENGYRNNNYGDKPRSFNREPNQYNSYRGNDDRPRSNYGKSDQERPRTYEKREPYAPRATYNNNVSSPRPSFNRTSTFDKAPVRDSYTRTSSFDNGFNNEYKPRFSDNSYQNRKTYGDKNKYADNRFKREEKGREEARPYKKRSNSFWSDKDND
ncbi:ribonuclease R [Mycoplasmopsis agassizii]|uniref:ribonuclease R n=1 Tax=Mycoplasmopsis agassizii TaxID=33922 RepID=UPI0035276308